MSLQQLSHIKRILFLREFVAEIVTHSAEDERLKKLIKVERIKRKLIPEAEPSLEHIGNSIIFNNPPNKEFQKSKKILEAKHSFHRTRPPRKNKKIIRGPRPRMNKNNQHDFKGHETRNTEQLMEKINKLIYDKNIQMIECAGPGKNVLVKVRNNVNATKLNLNEAEIKNIIMYFSDISRIPIVGGILKTSIESMIISAVVSEYAGSRFIISKRNPYDLIGRIGNINS